MAENNKPKPGGGNKPRPKNGGLGQDQANKVDQAPVSFDRPPPTDKPKKK